MQLRSVLVPRQLLIFSNESYGFLCHSSWQAACTVPHSRMYTTLLIYGIGILPVFNKLFPYTNDEEEIRIASLNIVSL